MTTSISTDGSKRRKPSERGGEQPAATAPDAPSAELLEFLGEFEDESGTWIDPLDLEAAGATQEPPSDGESDD